MTTDLEKAVANIIQTHTIEDIQIFISTLQCQLDKKQEKIIEKAKQDFISAYKTFRKLAPYNEHWVQLEDVDGFASDYDLYDIIDTYLLKD